MITIPTIQQLYTAILSDLETAYGNNIPLFGKNFLRALASVQAAKLKLYYLAIGNLQKNIFVDTAEPEAIGGSLERFGRVKLNRNPLPAVAAQYEVEVTGTVGAVIPAQTVFKSDDNSVNPGKLFILDLEFELTSSPDTITLRALEAGVDSAMDVGETMTATIPLVDVNKSVEVTNEVIEPIAAETIEEYRDNVIQAYRTEPQGGSVSDYRIWALDAQGVSKTYPYVTPSEINGVDLYVEATVADSTDGKGTPSAGLLTSVEEVVELDPDETKDIYERGRRPIQVVVHYLPIIPLDVTIVFSSFTGTASEESLIETAITEHMSLIRPFISGSDVVSERNDVISVNQLIGVVMQAAPAVVFGGLVLNVDGVPVATYQFENGEIPYLDSITF